MDLSLDTTRKNGHTTLLDGMWAGVPTVYLDGGGGALRRRAGVSASGNNRGGARASTGAGSMKEYEGIAGRMVGDGELRWGVRVALSEQKLDRGGLFDSEGYAKEFGGLLRSIVNVNGGGGGGGGWG